MEGIVEVREMHVISVPRDILLERLRAGEAIRLSSNRSHAYRKGEVVFSVFPSGTRTFLEVAGEPEIQKGGASVILPLKIFLVNGVSYCLQKGS